MIKETQKQIEKKKQCVLQWQRYLLDHGRSYSVCNASPDLLRL